jgi:hypothetical protein
MAGANGQRPASATRGGMTDEEAAARAANAEPWEPLPGMVKLRCTTCRYFFAASAPDLPRLRPASASGGG